MLSGLPLFAGFHQEGGDQPQAGSLIREDAHHLYSPADLFIDTLRAVCDPNRAVVLQRKIKDHKFFSKILLQAD